MGMRKKSVPVAHQFPRKFYTKTSIKPTGAPQNSRKAKISQYPNHSLLKGDKVFGEKLQLFQIPVRPSFWDSRPFQRSHMRKRLTLSHFHPSTRGQNNYLSLTPLNLENWCPVTGTCHKFWSDFREFWALGDRSTLFRESDFLYR